MDNEIEQKEFNLGYKARVKEILKQQRKREAKVIQSYIFYLYFIKAEQTLTILSNIWYS